MQLWRKELQGDHELGSRRVVERCRALLLRSSLLQHQHWQGLYRAAALVCTYTCCRAGCCRHCGQSGPLPQVVSGWHAAY